MDFWIRCCVNPGPNLRPKPHPESRCQQPTTLFNSPTFPKSNNISKTPRGHPSQLCLSSPARIKIFTEGTSPPPHSGGSHAPGPIHKTARSTPSPNFSTDLRSWVSKLIFRPAKAGGGETWKSTVTRARAPITASPSADPLSRHASPLLRRPITHTALSRFGSGVFAVYFPLAIDLRGCCISPLHPAHGHPLP